MKYLFALLLFVRFTGYGQLTIDSAKSATLKYHLGQYSYMDAFVGFKGYGAPVILTADGGAAAFGSGEYKDGKPAAYLVKVDKDGKDQWQRAVFLKHEEAEGQCVAQDKKGNYYVFILEYDPTGNFRGGTERIVYIDKTSKILWDKRIGQFTSVNNPVISYTRLLPDGRIYMRGHVTKELPPEGKDPVARYWEGWIDSLGKLTQKSGEPIDWKKDEWQKRLKPE